MTYRKRGDRRRLVARALLEKAIAFSSCDVYASEAFLVELDNSHGQKFYTFLSIKNKKRIEPFERFNPCLLKMAVNFRSSR